MGCGGPTLTTVMQAQVGYHTVAQIMIGIQLDILRPGKREGTGWQVILHLQAHEHVGCTRSGLIRSLVVAPVVQGCIDQAVA